MHILSNLRREEKSTFHQCRRVNNILVSGTKTWLRCYCSCAVKPLICHFYHNAWSEKLRLWLCSFSIVQLLVGPFFIPQNEQWQVSADERHSTLWVSNLNILIPFPSFHSEWRQSRILTSREKFWTHSVSPPKLMLLQYLCTTCIAASLSYYCTDANRWCFYCMKKESC